MSSFRSTMSGHDNRGRVAKMTYFSQGANVGAVSASAIAAAAALQALTNCVNMKVVGPGANGQNGYF